MKKMGPTTIASTPLIDRLDALSMPEPTTGCTLWFGSVQRKNGANGHGYGRMSWRSRMHFAHRLAWIASKGPIPDGLLVLHRCDNPACVNPDHLRLGTHTENMADMVAKGRGRMAQLNRARRTSAATEA